MATYSGNLIATARDPALEQAGNFHPDPRHAIRDTSANNAASHQVSAALGVEYSGTDFPVGQVVGMGMVLDCPRRSHEGRAGRHQIYTDDQARERMAECHSEDGQYRTVRAKWAMPPLQDSREEYSDAYAESPSWGEHQNNTGAVAILRGAHTDIAQNNPKGIRPGVYRTWIMRADRRLGRRAYRYEVQPAYQRGAGVTQEPNVPATLNYNPHAGGMAFDTFLPTGVNTRLKVPALWRTPPDVDEAALATDTTTNGSVIDGGVL
jgi:hypothetical protein